MPWWSLSVIGPANFNFLTSTCLLIYFQMSRSRFFFIGPESRSPGFKAYMRAPATRPAGSFTPGTIEDYHVLGPSRRATPRHLTALDTHNQPQTQTTVH